MIRALDYEDRIGFVDREVHLQAFYCCRAKHADGTTCGMYMAGRLWKKRQRRNGTSTHTGGAASTLRISHDLRRTPTTAT
eukprot:9075258-Prorocentrum_lima.AAC.1